MKIMHTDRKDIVVAIQSGSGTAAELGNKYGVTAGRIAVIYRKETGSYLRPLSKPPRRLSHDEKETIVAEIQAQKTTMTELAQRYGVTITAISDVFKRMTGKGLKPQLPPSDMQAIVAELQSGNVAIQDLATRYHVSPSTIGRNFKRITGRAFLSRLSQQDKKAIVAELQSSKTTMKELAIRYGIHPDTISRGFKKLTGKPFGIGLSQTEREAIVRELQSGKATRKDLATKYHVHPDTVSSVFKKMTGKPLRPRPHRLSQQDREAIVTALQSGKTPKELTSIYDVSSGRIGQVYKEATGKGWRVNKLSQSDKEAIIAALKAKKTTMTALAAKYGVDQPTITHLFKKMTGISFSQYKKTVEANELVISEGMIMHKLKKGQHDVDVIVRLMTKYAEKYPHAKITYSFVDHTITVETI